MNTLKKIMLLSVFGWGMLHAEEYTFGNGWQAGNTPLVLGGYISSTLDLNKNTDTFYIDDIALLAYGEFDHFDFLAEFETEDIYIKEIGNNHDKGGNFTIQIERLYGDYFFGDSERLRFGKFNSDIGFWNQMPINVLRDTTSSPHYTEDFFPKFTTGIHIESHPAAGALSRVSLTVQHNNDLDSDYNNFIIDRHYGVACDIGDNNVLWRFGGGYFQEEPAAREAWYATGALRMEEKQWNLILESVLRHDTKDGKMSYDVYAQGVWHLIAQHDLVVRAEVEKAPVTRTHDGSATVGYAYRPLTNVALKGEYEAHQESLLNRWLFSFSVLF